MTYVELDPVVSEQVRPGRVRLQLIYESIDEPTPRYEHGRRTPRREPPPGTRAATLSPPGGGRPVTLDRVGQRVVAGRQAGCDIVIDYDYASKKHVTFELREDGLQIRDNDSANGTFVNDRSVRDLVVSGDAEIRLGRSEPVRLTWS
jgi:pSer/pThr/pTyr-binding forkhead associated (FHA) protein